MRKNKPSAQTYRSNKAKQTIITNIKVEQSGNYIFCKSKSGTPTKYWVLIYISWFSNPFDFLFQRTS